MKVCGNCKFLNSTESIKGFCERAGINIKLVNYRYCKLLKEFKYKSDDCKMYKVIKK